jgi:alpha-beta hydrolase superfamily lysophospholipase
MKLLTNCKKKKDESYATDPLVYHGSFRALWGYNIIGSMKDAMAKASTAKFPFLLVHGEDDVICLPDDSQKFYDLAGSADKQIIRYPGLKHEVMNEIEKDVCFFFSFFFTNIYLYTIIILSI